MVLVIGALELCRYGQVLLIRAVLGPLLMFLWQSRAELAEVRLRLPEAPTYTVETVLADPVSHRWWAHRTRWQH
jgi:hypothetical protein